VNIYIQLTKEFNEGRLRAIISSAQAVVLHRLAIMSKDGDWILRETESDLGHVLRVLERHGSRYRYGAPLDVRWMAGGWSAHFEFSHDRLRVRADFFTRPPRIPSDQLSRLWKEHAGDGPPFLNVRDLAEMKKTNRERDYAVIGELARRMTQIEDQILYSRSSRDLIRLGEQNPGEIARLSKQRPALRAVTQGRDRLEVELDAERRTLIHANEERLEAYANASARWQSTWPHMTKEIAGLSLLEAHRIIVKQAESVLPMTVSVPES
jgi:hypothetical protein